MASLSGFSPASTFASLIKTVDNLPLDANPRQLSDGVGNLLPISASTAAINLYSTTITGSLNGNASTSTSASYALSSSRSVTSSLAFTASYAQSISTSISSQNILHNVLFVDTTGPSVVQVDGGLRYNPNTDLLITTSSYATSASYAVSSSYTISSSFAQTASFVNVLVQNVTITGSISATSVLTLTPQTPLPAASTLPNSFAVSASSPTKPYFSDGTNWNPLY